MPDSNITLRSIKGSGLSHSEMDGNFREFFYSASVSGSEVRLYRSQSSNQFETINLSEPKGPQFALQLKKGVAESGASITFTGSKSLTYDFSASVLSVTGSSFFSGDMTVDGAVTANTFIADTVIEGISTGSTSFGKDKSDDVHIRTGSMFIDGDFDVTGRISSAQPLSASVDWTRLTSIPSGIVSASDQVVVEDTTGFGGLQANISASFAGSASAHTQRVATVLTLSASAHTDRVSKISVLSASVDTHLDANITALSSSAHTANLNLSSSIHTNYLKNTSDTLTGNLTVTGFISASELHTEYVTSSIVLATGSNQFGDEVTDVHSFTGSVNISGSQSIVGDVTFSNDVTITGGLDVTGTLNATVEGTTATASYVAGADVDGAVANATNANTASYIDASNVDGTLDISTQTNLGVTDTTGQTGINFTLSGDNITGTLAGLGTSADVQFDSFGVGTAASGTTGEIRATGDITAFYSSDKRLKDNVTPLSDAINKINQIGGYEFDWNSNSSHSGHDVGVIAQEIEEVLPEVVVTRDNGYKAVRYEKIVALLIEAIKDQQSQIDELKSRLD